jgi:hypothetical protein
VAPLAHTQEARLVCSQGGDKLRPYTGAAVVRAVEAASQGGGQGGDLRLA